MHWNGFVKKEINQIMSGAKVLWNTESFSIKPVKLATKKSYYVLPTDFSISGKMLFHYLHIGISAFSNLSQTVITRRQTLCTVSGLYHERGFCCDCKHLSS